MWETNHISCIPSTECEGKSPSSIVHAIKDPNNANLDRIQIIKGGLDANGDSNERIYDVAVSDGCEIAKNGRSSAPVGNTINVEEAYRFVLGEQIVSTTGISVQLSRPLDFLVVTDHAEGMGAMYSIYDGNEVMMQDASLKRWHDYIGYRQWSTFTQ